MASSLDFISLDPDNVKTKITQGDATITVIGLGWMGVATAALYMEAGAQVLGADKDPAAVTLFEKGLPPKPEPGTDLIFRKAFKEGRVAASVDISSAASRGEVIVITVPTLATNREADYSALLNVSKRVGLGIEKGSCIIVMSTCAPMVMEDHVKQILEKYSGLQVGEDFALAYSPIRAMTGRALQDMKNYPRILGAYTSENLRIAEAVLSVVIKGEIVKMSSMRAAEAVKVFETTYRDVNIALSNELAQLCERLGIDYYEIREAANTQPYSHLHKPGVGVGGHCIPVYSYLLLDAAEDVDVKLRLVEYARKINELAPKRTVQLIASSLKECGRHLARSRITLLGLSYREDVKEMRMSPALDVASILVKRGAKVTIYDPFYQPSEIDSLDVGVQAASTLQSALTDVHCAAIMVAHREFKSLRASDLAAYMGKQRAVVDGPGILDPVQVGKVGLVYRGIGKGVK